MAGNWTIEIMDVPSDRNLHSVGIVQPCLMTLEGRVTVMVMP